MHCAPRTDSQWLQPEKINWRGRRGGGTDGAVALVRRDRQEWGRGPCGVFCGGLPEWAGQVLMRCLLCAVHGTRDLPCTVGPAGGSPPRPQHTTNTEGGPTKFSSGHLPHTRLGSGCYSNGPLRYPTECRVARARRGSHSNSRGGRVHARRCGVLEAPRLFSAAPARPPRMLLPLRSPTPLPPAACLHVCARCIVLMQRSATETSRRAVQGGRAE